MSVSIRPLLIPGVAAAMALTPAVIPPAAPVLPAVAAPVVQIPTVELAGFTQDLYDALNGWAQFALQVAQDFFFWNPPIAEGLRSLYTSLEPIVAAVVRFIDTVVTGPGDLIGTLTAFVSNAFGLSNLLPAGAVRGASAGPGPTVRAAAAVGEPAASPPADRRAAGGRAAVIADVVPDPVADVVAEPAADVVAEVPVASGASESRRSSRAAGVRAARQTPAPAAAAAVQAAGQQDAPAVRSAAKADRAEGRVAARVARSAR